MAFFQMLYAEEEEYGPAGVAYGPESVFKKVQGRPPVGRGMRNTTTFGGAEQNGLGIG